MEKVIYINKKTESLYKPDGRTPESALKKAMGRCDKFKSVVIIGVRHAGSEGEQVYETISSDMENSTQLWILEIAKRQLLE